MTVSLINQKKEKKMANDPFRTAPVYPNKKTGPQRPIPTKRGIAFA